MKLVIFHYDDNTITRHNAAGVSISEIIKLVGQTITDKLDTFNTKTGKKKSIEISHKIVRAEIY